MILVTGGAGYIGSHTCQMLASMGHTPIVFDNFSNGHKYAVKYGPYIEGDLNDSASIVGGFRKYNFDAVIHFASFIEVGESVKDPEKYYINNIGGALNLLHAMLEADVKTIVFSSTCAVYGTPESIPIKETTPTHPLSPYGQSKLAIERILKDYGNAYDFNYILCRYFNACVDELRLDCCCEVG